MDFNKKYLEVKLRNTTADTVYIQRLSIDKYESSTVVFNNDSFDSSKYDSYVLINNISKPLNEEMYPFTMSGDPYKESKRFLSANNVLPHKTINDDKYYIVAPKSSIIVRTVFTVQTDEIVRIPDMNKKEIGDLSFHIGFKIKHFTSSDPMRKPLWLQTPGSTQLKKILLHWMY